MTDIRIPVDPIAPSMVRALVTLARMDLPREICGFIRRDPLHGGYVIHPIPNVSEKENEFVMDEEEMLSFYRRWLDYIVGMYHSHPSGRTRPSEKDLDYAPNGMRYFIITVDGVFEWDLSGDTPIEVTP